MMAISQIGNLRTHFLALSFIVLFTVTLPNLLWLTPNKYSDYSDENYYQKPPSPIPELHTVSTTSRSENTTTNVALPTNVMLVHVGKAGGESIKSVLRIGCESKMNKHRRKECFDRLPSSILSEKIVQSYFHCYKMYPKNALSVSDGLLFVLRHPLERLKSWYRYVHPKNCPKGASTLSSPSCGSKAITREKPNGTVARFFHCFPDIQDLANSLSQSNECSTLGWDTILGNIPREEATFAHATANIRHYVKETVGWPDQSLSRTTQKILVLRTEELWKDFNRLEERYGGQHNKKLKQDTEFHFTHGSERFSSIGRQLNLTGTHSLCCALKEEVKAFLFLIKKAENLSPEEKYDSVQYIHSACDFSSEQPFEKVCQDAFPLSSALNSS